MSSETSGSISSVDSECHQMNHAKARLLECLSYRSRYIYLVRGKDGDREAWHFVQVDGDKKEVFLEKSKSGSLDVADYGHVLFSDWGKDPPRRLAYKLKCLDSELPAYLHLIRGNDNAWHYVLVDEDKRHMFEEWFKTGSSQGIDEYGKVLYSGWGQDPPDSISNKILSVYIRNESVDLCNKYVVLPHAFARSGRMEVIRQLIDKGFGINHGDYNGWSPLHHAAYIGKVDVVQFLIDIGADIHFKDKTCGRKPVHIAAREGHESVIKFFLAKSVKVDDADENGWVPLHYAAWKGSLEVVQCLVNSGVVTDVKDTHGKKPIHIAAENGHTCIVQYFLNNGVNIEDADVCGRTLLYFAAWNGQLDTVDFLIRQGANIHAENYSGIRPLHVAAVGGHIHIIERFLSEGLSADERTVDNNTPLHYSVLYNHIEAVKFLTEKGADVNVENDDGETPLDCAIRQGHTKILNILNILNILKIKCCPSLHFAAMKGNLKAVEGFVSQGANVNAVDKKNYTALHYAAKYGNLDVVNFLLGKGADVSTRSNPDTVLHLAVRSNEEELIKLVLKAVTESQEDMKLHVNAEDADGGTPLIWAARRGNINVIQMLLQYGANISAKDKDGLTALHRAAEEGHYGVVKLLVDKGADIYAMDNDGCQLIHHAAAHA